MRYSIATLAASAMLALGASSALADGMVSTKDVVAAPCCTANWSGIYIGAAVGYGIARSKTHYQVDSVQVGDILDPDNTQIPATQFFGDSTSSIASDGFTGTVTLGYDRDIGRNIVIGVFADYTFGDLESDFIPEYQQTVDFLPFGAQSTISLSNQWAVGARIGLTRSCCALWYLTAGYTQVDLDVEDHRERDTSGTPPEQGLGTRSSTLHGYFIGGGVEQQIYNNLTLKLEYRYSDFGDQNVYDVTQVFQCTPVPCTGAGIKRQERLEMDTDIHAVRLGLAYKFNREPEPVAPLK